mgnify:CR=1 FL=1
MIKKICCILDTCALSFLLEEFDKLDNDNKERFNIFESIKNEITDFIVPSIVIHELVLGLQENNNIGNDYLKIIINYLKLFFNNKFKTQYLVEDSANEYRNVFVVNKFNKDKYKHKMDALIVAQASHYASMYSNKNKYDDFWLITEDNKMIKYIANHIKIYSLEDAKINLGL